ncbi:ANTAR domain-containing protein [Streptomyces sp. NPDC060085]|uniref:ANTAR domain-containing protein n=1 Tax=Streptomyces sp. NPDC060085 TaxID=3347054 RepID=UPI00366051E8
MPTDPTTPILPGTESTETVTITVRRAADVAEVLCLSGSLDSVAAASFGRTLDTHAQHADSTGRRLILDFTDLRTITAAALSVLDGATRHLAARPILAVVSAPNRRELFTLCPLAGLRVYASLGEALASLPAAAAPPSSSTGAGPASELENLRREVFGLRAKSRTAPVIGAAQGIIRERYALPDSTTAFTALKHASQHLNVPLRVLASAVVTAPRSPRQGPWFPGRHHTAAPAIGLLNSRDARPVDRRKTIEAAVHDAVILTGAEAAELHLTDLALGDALVLEGHAGLQPAYLDQIALITGPPAPAAHAQTLKQAVAVPDVAADPALAATPLGTAALAAGSRALHSAPVLTHDGTCLGVITLHHTRPGTWMDTAQHTALTTLTDDLAAWRSWYRRTVLLDALEYLHTHARDRDT